MKAKVVNIDRGPIRHPNTGELWLTGEKAVIEIDRELLEYRCSLGQYRLEEVLEERPPVKKTATKKAAAKKTATKKTATKKATPKKAAAKKATPKRVAAKKAPVPSVQEMLS